MPLKSQIVSENYINRLEVKKNSEIQIQVDSLYIETLVMNRNSQLIFDQPTILIVEHAFIDINCKFNAIGKEGVAGKPIRKNDQNVRLDKLNGQDGSDGQSLKLVVNFEALGSLTINTSGGRGGKGADGYSGFEGERHLYNASVSQQHVAPVMVKGGSAGNGGDGGDAGDLEFYYYCNGFAPKLNDFQIHKLNNHLGSINLVYSGGMAGSRGKHGQGFSQYGYSGSVFAGDNVKPGDLDGSAGTTGMEGESGDLILKRMPD